MANQLFRRQWKVVVDAGTGTALDVSNLDVEFKILRTLKSEPNRCTLSLWNLNKEHRAQLLKRNRPNPTSSRTVGIRVQVDAGYVGNTSTLFLGDLREMSSVRDATDWKTTLAGDDGGRAYRESRVNKTFTKGTPLSTVLKQCVEALNLGSGNADKFLADAQVPALGGSLPHTMTLSGNAAQQLSRLLNSMGLTWSIQNGVVQVAKHNQPLDLAAVLLTPDTGLIGSPEAGIDASVSIGNAQASANSLKAAKKPKAFDARLVKVKSMLIPGLFPGRRVHLKSDSFDGDYVLTECEYLGQSWGQDWYVQSIARQFT